MSSSELCVGDGSVCAQDDRRDVSCLEWSLYANECRRDTFPRMAECSKAAEDLDVVGEILRRNLSGCGCGKLSGTGIGDHPLLAEGEKTGASATSEYGDTTARKVSSRYKAAAAEAVAIARARARAQSRARVEASQSGSAL